MQFEQKANKTTKRLMLSIFRGYSGEGNQDAPGASHAGQRFVSFCSEFGFCDSFQIQNSNS